MPIFKKYKLKAEIDESRRIDLEKKVSDPKDVVKVLNIFIELNKNTEEVAVLVCLNTKKEIIGIFEVSRGEINSSVIHPREVFKRAISINSASIILAHNHPSGDTDPSKDDMAITRRLKDAGGLIGVKLLDHIIVGDITNPNDFVSLKEKGVI